MKKDFFPQKPDNNPKIYAYTENTPEYKDHVKNFIIAMLAIDRPLDMFRTMVNITSDSVGSAVIAKSEGEASRFEQLLIEYQRAPKVTRERLYLDAIESVFSNTNKVLIDNDNGNSLMYLPIDRLIDNNNTNKKPSTSNSTFNNLLENQTPSSTNNLQNNLNSRLRGSR